MTTDAAGPQEIETQWCEYGQHYFVDPADVQALRPEEPPPPQEEQRASQTMEELVASLRAQLTEFQAEHDRMRQELYDTFYAELKTLRGQLTEAQQAIRQLIEAWHRSGTLAAAGQPSVEDVIRQIEKR